MRGHFLPHGRFQDFIDALMESGYRCVGPKLRDGAIVYEPLAKVDELPWGLCDRQYPGEYRVASGQVSRYFAWATGPQALKPLIFTPREVLWRAKRQRDGRIVFQTSAAEADKTAVIGVRACDLAALGLQDQHFLEGPYADPFYAARRDKLLLVAVNCSHPADTCFCASTGDGPHAVSGFDLALTELDDGFVVHAGSDAGSEVADRLSLVAATRAQLKQEQAQAAASAASQTRRLPSRNLRDALFGNLEHPRWDDVADRCLACGNCTNVCPTCFCHAQLDVPTLAATDSEHVREWDSCFTQKHCHMHGYRVRPHIRQRYRQWLTHKLGSWHDQYGRSGCVGCGRCITWCPVGIDITVEATAICGESLTC